MFNTGVLIDPDAHPTYDYAAAPAAVLERAHRLRHACEERGVALGAAALQFAMAHPAVTTVLVGARSAAEVAVDTGYAATLIDDDLIEELAAIEERR